MGRMPWSCIRCQAPSIDDGSAWREAAAAAPSTRMPLHAILPLVLCCRPFVERARQSLIRRKLAPEVTRWTQSTVARLHCAPELGNLLGPGALGVDEACNVRPHRASLARESRCSPI